MPNIKLPDGNSINFAKTVTGLQIAEKISKSILKQALVISVDGSLKDLNYPIEYKGLEFHTDEYNRIKITDDTDIRNTINLVLIWNLSLKKPSFNSQKSIFCKP